MPRNAVDELDQLLGLGRKQRPLPTVLQGAGYSHVRELGTGGFGAALLLYNTKTREHVVAKYVNLGTMSIKNRKAAHNEIHILQNMDHPNIVKYIDFAEDNNHLYILMEYADGGDLYSLIKKLKARGQRMSEEQAITLFIQVAMAVKYMHDQRMLHRDIKAQNVFLTKSHVVKLGDFGISTVLQNTVAMAKTMCGTPCYFSPELCQGHEYNNKSDVWALGVLLYEMLTLRLPFEIANMKKLLDSIVNCRAPRLPTGFSEPISSLVAAMLEKDPAKRPDINGVLRHRVLQNKIPSLVGQLTDLCPKAVLGRSPPRVRNSLERSAVKKGSSKKPAAEALPPLRQPQPQPQSAAAEPAEKRAPPVPSSSGVPAPPPRGVPPAATGTGIPQTAGGGGGPGKGYQSPALAYEAVNKAPVVVPPRAEAQPDRVGGGGGLGLGIQVPSRIAQAAAQERDHHRVGSNSPQAERPAPVRHSPPPRQQKSPSAEPLIPPKVPRQPTPPAVEDGSRQASFGRTNSGRLFPRSQQPPTREEPPVPVGDVHNTTILEAGAEALLLAVPSPLPTKQQPVRSSTSPLRSRVVESLAGPLTSDLQLQDVQGGDMETDHDEYESLASVIRNLESLTSPQKPGAFLCSSHGQRRSTNKKLGVDSIRVFPVTDTSSTEESQSGRLGGEQAADAPQPPPPPVGSSIRVRPCSTVEVQEDLVATSMTTTSLTSTGGQTAGAEARAGSEVPSEYTATGNEVEYDEDQFEEEGQEEPDSFVDPFGAKVDMEGALDEDLSIHTDFDVSVQQQEENQRFRQEEESPQRDTTGTASGHHQEEDDDHTCFDVLCLCERVRLVGDFAAIYGSFTCRCEICKKVSGSNAVELLHLPEVESFADLSCLPEGHVSRQSRLSIKDISDPSLAAFHLPANYRHKPSGSIVHFCSTCGTFLGADHVGISGCVVAKTALSLGSLELLLAHQHSSPPPAVGVSGAKA